ncbi:helix-turn-helix domain-containing protein [Actinomadura sp. ATCC 31491]|uniref:Helix-turn-helix domain-containing protein n=1 Tax=Actinomadura luzonensis TaxID=2805427 RepID=A0ABT0G0L1_9ACTN|nr:helix-turn-helix transcriptional regulator [Actinomadura luzonensis]MCK2218123.1 helix-turn-helix domain-containing protein [Actinomadura luzonensis]
MDPHVAALLGIDLDDPEVQRENAAIDRDMRLIETLVRIRKERGLTQADVAERMGRSQPAVSDFERLGGDPHLSTIRRYALAIGVEVVHAVSVSDAPSTTSSVPVQLRLKPAGFSGSRGATTGTFSLDLKQAVL